MRKIPLKGSEDSIGKEGKVSRQNSIVKAWEWVRKNGHYRDWRKDSVARDVGKGQPLLGLFKRTAQFTKLRVMGSSLHFKDIPVAAVWRGMGREQ